MVVNNGRSGKLRIRVEKQERTVVDCIAVYQEMERDERKYAIAFPSCCSPRATGTPRTFPHIPASRDDAELSRVESVALPLPDKWRDGYLKKKGVCLSEMSQTSSQILIQGRVSSATLTRAVSRSVPMTYVIALRLCGYDCSAPVASRKKSLWCFERKLSSFPSGVQPNIDTERRRLELVLRRRQEDMFSYTRAYMRAEFHHGWSRGGLSAHRVSTTPGETRRECF